MTLVQPALSQYHHVQQSFVSLPAIYGLVVDGIIPVLLVDAVINADKDLISQGQAKDKTVKENARIDARI